jgi:ribosomal protein L17
MSKSILELITDIIERGEFERCKTSAPKLKKHVENLFNMHKKERSQATARLIYSAIVDLARLGKGELAHEFAVRFEREIGSNMLE